MPSDQHRAGRIESTLLEYRDPDDEAAMTDLLTDAMHYCLMRGRDFELILRRARRHFDFERQQPEGEQP
jgi:hypothetical protein